MRVLVPFTKDTEGRLSGVVRTLLPSTTYEFSVYSFNATNYNVPSAYSLPVTTPPVRDNREFVFEACGCKSKNDKISSQSKFAHCMVRLNYQRRTFVFPYDLMCSISMVLSQRKQYVYEVCRMVHVSLLEHSNNLFLLFKYQLPYDRIEFLKICLTDDMEYSDEDYADVVVSDNMKQILQQMETILAVDIVCALAFRNV